MKTTQAERNERDKQMIITMWNLYDPDRPERWFPPLQLGGSCRSHHSRTLRRLCKQGYVEHTPPQQNAGRPSYRYRLTDCGFRFGEALYHTGTTK